MPKFLPISSIDPDTPFAVSLKISIIVTALLASSGVFAQNQTTLSGIISAPPTAAASKIPAVSAISGVPADAYKPVQPSANGGAGVQVTSNSVMATVNNKQVVEQDTYTTTRAREVLYSCDQWSAYNGGKINPRNTPKAIQSNGYQVTAVEQNGWFAKELYSRSGARLGFGGAVVLEQDLFKKGVLAKTEKVVQAVGSCESPSLKYNKDVVYDIYCVDGRTVCKAQLCVDGKTTCPLPVENNNSN